MESLFAKNTQLLRLTSMDFVRDAMSAIDWDAPMVCIRGPRGVGKTTLMLQYIKMHYRPMNAQVLYCSLDSVYFSTHSVLSLADAFYKNGGKHLFLDEVHKYETWSKELKEMYDLYPDMRIVISGSSVLNLMTGDADLSRRCLTYDIQGLSFREFLRLYKGIDLPSHTIDDILEHPDTICTEVLSICHPLPLFKEYLQYGYYPFYLKHKSRYYTYIEQIINYVVETELPQVFKVEVGMMRKIKALMGIIADSIPYEVDATKLGGVIGVHRTTVVNYLYMLDKAKVVNMLFSCTKNVRKLQKPDKVYLENTNLLYALSSSRVDIGTARETFCINQLRQNHLVEYGKDHGDFLIDGRWTIEVGGQSKGFSQIAGVSDSYVLADDMESPFGRKIPLWAIGFVY